MPLAKRKGQKVVSKNIKELHGGPKFAANVKKHGKAKANKIAVATALDVARD